MKTSTQLKALIRNLAEKKNTSHEIILRNFMLERLLERISLSKYKNNLILKGGMLISAMVGINTRATMDIDTVLKKRNFSEADIEAMIKEILSIPVDDNVKLAFKKIEEIHEEADYPGYRVSIEAVLDKTKQTIKIDISTGDFVTPKEIKYDFQLMFENRSIPIMAYNAETVLAEKLETILSRDITNTRMRDFYDIYVLTKTHSFDKKIFKSALEKTSQNRNTTPQVSEAGRIIEIIETNLLMADLWKRYQKKYAYAADITWAMAMDSVKRLSLLS
ncbi:MAG: nucleotidyl transferase AbiEii/AbiGii toxin family protein [Endomicrobia bacterium]|nr:nucleotidyl transferase AbiEii/AbiGii toxin family protein [Endomicrobiia bacterium]